MVTNPSDTRSQRNRKLVAVKVELRQTVAPL